MEFVGIILIAISLSFDSFAVSVSSGLSNQKIIFFNAIKIAFSLALFQALMPVVGWFVGISIKDHVEAYDHWIAFILLAGIGLKMIYDGMKNETVKPFDPLKITVLISISIATSIDALIVGLSFGFIEIKILFAALIIGFVTFMFSVTGILFGKKAGEKLGVRATVLGGIVLIGIGLKILVEHTML